MKQHVLSGFQYQKQIKSATNVSKPENQGEFETLKLFILSLHKMDLRKENLHQFLNRKVKIGNEEYAPVYYHTKEEAGSDLVICVNTSDYQHVLSVNLEIQHPDAYFQAYLLHNDMITQYQALKLNIENPHNIRWSDNPHNDLGLTSDHS